MTQDITLVPGQLYHFVRLQFVGWNTGDIVCGGVDHTEWFEGVPGLDSGCGRYLGADACGVAPLYAPETTADLVDSESMETLRKATVAEMAESLNCGQSEGHFLVDGRRCFVAA